jgi:hypothetical protein
MNSIVSKDENLISSAPVVGYKLMKFIQTKNSGRVSIFDVTDHFRNEKWFTPKTLYYAMVFLFSLEIIDFSNSYIVIKNHVSVS